MPRRPLHFYDLADEFLVEQLPPEFWILMRSMLPMRSPTEASTLCRELDGNNVITTDLWSVVTTNCGYLISQGRLHIGHIQALVHARTRSAIAASRAKRFRRQRGQSRQ